MSFEDDAAKYGYSIAFLNAYPEIKDLVQKAIKADWSVDVFQAKFANSNFWKTHGDAARKAAVLQVDDPAEYGAMWNRTQQHVAQMLGQQGGSTSDWATINAVAGKIIFEGWNDERAMQEIGQHVTFGTNGQAGGKAGEAQAELNQYAYNMGVKNSDTWIQQAVRDIASGKKTPLDYKNQIMQQAIAAFPSYADQFKAGSTLQDLAQPYIQSMSSILEIAPGQVNLFDDSIRNALNYKGSDGKVGAKPLWQFQNDLRSDPRWKLTQNAQDASMGVAHKVLQDFGLYY